MTSAISDRKKLVPYCGQLGHAETGPPFDDVSNERPRKVCARPWTLGHAEMGPHLMTSAMPKRCLRNSMVVGSAKCLHGLRAWTSSICKTHLRMWSAEAAALHDLPPAQLEKAKARLTPTLLRQDGRIGVVLTPHKISSCSRKQLLTSERIVAGSDRRLA
jgi:hypothetical protein